MKKLNTVFPFYDSLSEQSRYNSEDNTVLFINCLKSKLPGFIFTRDHSGGTANEITVNIVPCNGGNTISIDGEDVLEIVNGTYGEDWIYYNGSTLEESIPDSPGGYYLDIVDTYETPNKHYYSEIFGVRDSLSGLVHLTFSKDVVLSGIMAGYEQEIYIDCDMKAPKYIREDTGSKRDGLLVREKMVIMKSQIVRFSQVPEFLADALTLVPMMDSVRLTRQDGVEISAYEAQVGDPEWSKESFGWLADIDVNIITDIVISKLNFKEMPESTTSRHVEPLAGSMVALTTKRITFEQAFETSDYSCTFTAHEADGSPAFPEIISKTATFIEFQCNVECDLSGVAVE